MKPYTLTVTDSQGEQVFTCEVACGVPQTIGWNLCLEQGRLGLATEIVTAIVEHELGSGNASEPDVMQDLR